MKLALNSDPCFAQEEPFIDALQNMCSKKFHKIHRKNTRSATLFKRDPVHYG